MDSDLNPILDDLAAGRIDQAEARRRIMALPGWVGSVEANGPTTESGAETAPPRGAAQGSTASWGAIARGLAGAASGLAGATAHRAAAVVAEQVAAARTVTTPPVDQTQRPSGSQGIERVVVRATGRRITVVGDATVSTVMVEGPHERRRTGGTLEISTASELVGGGLDVSRLVRGLDLADLPRLARGEVRGDDVRRLATGKPVVVRVNPQILLDIEASASQLVVEKVGWLGRVRVTAGTATFTDLVEVQDALVQAATVTMSGRFFGPQSRVRVESGTLSLHLPADADVSVRGEASLGRIAWPLESSGTHRHGLGTGQLELGVTLGRATVTQAE